MEVGQWKNDEKLVRAYVGNQLDTYYWLKGMGVNWTALEALAGMSVPRAHATDPVEMLKILKEVAERKGARIFFETGVTGLLTDEDGRVIGVDAQGKQGSLRVRAMKGIVLATGGFGRDTKRLEAIDPRLPQVTVVAGLGHTGDGHRMAEELGAFVKDVEYVKPTFGIHVTGTTMATVLLMFYNGAIIVNKKGERFVNESLSYKDLGKAALSQPDGIGFQIFDQRLYEVGLEKAKDVLPEKAVWGLDEGRMKLLVEAETIEELASKIIVPPEALRETIDKYNNQVDAGKDSDFGRAALVGAVGRLVRIDTPPFYAYETKGNLPSTYGGIAVDEDMHVISRQGKVVGLYAAGEIVGGFHGVSYMSGSAVAKAVIFGRIAGKNAARGR